MAFLDNHFREGERINLSADFFDKRLQEGSCLVLLDGLDEVSDEREEVAQHIQSFIQCYGQKLSNRIGLSSRPRGYESVKWQLSASDMAVAEVHPLDPQGIRRLLRNLLTLIELDQRQGEKDVEGLNQAILSSDSLTEIAGTPLFRAALVQVYKYRGAHLPQRRVDVLEEIVELLLANWRLQQSELVRADELAVGKEGGANHAGLRKQ